MKKNTLIVIAVLLLGAIALYVSYVTYTPDLSDLPKGVIDICPEEYNPTSRGCCQDNACTVVYGTLGNYVALYYPTNYAVADDLGASKIITPDNGSAVLTFDMVTLEAFGAEDINDVLEIYASNTSGFQNDVKLGIFFGHRGYRIQGTMFSEQHNEILFREDYVFELPSEYLAIITILDLEPNFNASRAELAPHLEEFEIGEWNLTD